MEIPAGVNDSQEVAGQGP